MSADNAEAHDFAPATRAHPMQNHGNWSLLGGLTTTVFVLGGVLIGGRLSNALEAQELIAMMTPAMQMLAFAAITATGTILALMLTMLSLIHESKAGLQDTLHAIVLRISRLCTIDFVASALLLGLVGIPFGEADSEPSLWFTVLYYVLILANAAISGLLVAIILMLFDAIRHTIRMLNAD